MLTPDEMTIAKFLLADDEGIELFPYMDCCGKPWRQCSCTPKFKGKLSIAVGRNLEDFGISENEAMGLLENNVKRTTIEIERSFPWFSKLNTPRRLVVVSMVFNLGLNGFKGFKKFIGCLDSGDFASASAEMLKSKWASQVGDRAERLSKMMKTGIIHV